MKILHTISSMDPQAGGVCQVIRNVAPFLNKNGVENTVLCLDDPQHVYGIVDPFTIIKTGPARNPYAYTPAFTLWLETHIAEFDVVIIHGLWLYNSYGTYRVWKKLKNKTEKKLPSLFVMPHGMLDPYFQKAPERKLKAIRNEIFWRMIEKRVVNGCTGVLFTCEKELELARETFKQYNPKKELNVGLGVDRPPVFEEDMRKVFLSKAGLADTDRYWLFLSRIHQKKGVGLLIEAYKQLKKEKDSLPKLVIAGPLDSVYADEMKSKAVPCEDIVFTGMLKGDAKWGALYGCEVFILPSHQENFGIAVVEAMACGKPVAITDKVNIYTVIADANAGFIFRDDQGGTCHILKKIENCAHEELLQKGKNAEDTYLKHYLPETAAEILLETIKE